MKCFKHLDCLPVIAFFTVGACLFCLAACAQEPGSRPLPTVDGGAENGDGGTGVGICGNGIIEEGEECDDGNLMDGDGCSPECKVEPGWSCSGEPSVCVNLCGNNVLDPGEQCDGDLLGGNDCTTIPGNYTGGTLKCSPACLFDTTECILPGCGNGILDPGEECDHGEENSTTGECLPNCKLATCGDGYVWEGVEECDDGNTSNNDSCLNNCKLATCGDGYVWTGVEECDDGALNSDTTPNACRTDCTLPRCGDGVVDSGEECDDGNNIAGDGCSPDCKIEKLPVLYSIENTTSGWSSLTLTYAGKPHAPTHPVIAAANAQTRGEAYIFTQSTYHVLTVPGMEWIEHDSIPSKFPGANGANITFAYGVSWGHSSASDIALFEGEWLRIFSIDNTTGEVTPSENNPLMVDWSDAGDYPPEPHNVKASWLALENNQGWTPGSPGNICEAGGSADTVGPHAAMLTLGNSLHLYEAGYCWEFHHVMPIGDYPPFSISGGPAAAQITAAFYASPKLYVIAMP